MAYKIPVTKELYIKATEQDKKKKKEQAEQILTEKEVNNANLNKAVGYSQIEKILSLGKKPQGKEIKEKDFISSTGEESVERTGERSGEESGEVNKHRQTSDGYESQIAYYEDLIKRFSGMNVQEMANEKYASEKKQKDDTTDEELYTLAQKYANALIKPQVDKAVKNSEEREISLNKQIDEINNKTQKALNNIISEYETKDKSAKNKAIKGGIARSSIIENLLKQNQKERIGKSEQARLNADADLKALNEQITLVKEQLKDSLATYDMKTAIELNDRLEQLKTERDNRNAEIDAHNKEIDKKIANYAEELSKTEDGKAIVDLIQGRSGKYAVELKKAIIRYFSSIPAKQARKELDEGKYAHLMDKATYNTINDYITYVLQNA